MLAGPPRTARLHILGGCRLLTAESRDATPRGAKARGLLAYLALSPEGCADRGKVAGLLWSESADAKASLRQSVREIRTTLAEAGADVLSADTHAIRLDLGAIWVDVLEVTSLARSADPADLERITALYAGDLLDTVEVRDAEFHDWLLVERARLRRQVCDALERWLDLSLETHALDGARRAAEALLSLEPAQEAAHRALMCWHASQGDTAAAIRQYQTCRAALARELDLEPSTETETLLQDIRDHGLRRQASRPPPAAPEIPSLGPRPGAPMLASRRPHHAVIAVEPKASALGDLADQSLAAALATSLREALSRIRWLSVVDAGLYFPLGADAPHAMPRQFPDPSYYVYVSILRARDRVRLTAEMKDAETARIVFADHHDRVLTDDLFGVVDVVAGVLAGKLAEEVRVAETMRVSRKPIEELSPYECVLRAIPLIFKLTPESFAQAEQLLLNAQAMDPSDSMVYAWRAFWYSIDIGQSWVGDLEGAKAELDYLVRRAIELDPKNGLALSVAGHIASYVRHDYERALGLFEQSLRIDPSSVYAWDSSAVTLCYAGKAEEALRQLEASRDLWEQHPDPYYFRTTSCIALLLAGQPEQAAAVGRRTVRENPQFQAAYRPLIASLGLIGNREEAEAYLSELRRLHPDFSIGWFRESYPPLRGEAAERYIEGLRKAGAEE